MLKYYTGLSTLRSEVQATDPMWESCFLPVVGSLYFISTKIGVTVCTGFLWA